MDPPPPSLTHSSSYTSFPILAFSILGILTTAILLLSYYLFIVKCCLHWRRTDLLPFRIRRRTETMHIQHPQLTESHGLNSAAICSIPTLRYVKAGSLNPVECTVCLAELEDQEPLRVLPGCKHSFHIDCIDTWLQSCTKCPLCRFDISRVPLSSFLYRETERGSSMVIDVAESNNASGTHTPTRMTPKASKSRRFRHVASKGDECIDISRPKDERFTVQPIRRSFSMDSSNDRSLFLAVQEIMQQTQNLGCEMFNGEGSSNDGCRSASGRIRRSFFSFGRSSKSRMTVLPMQSEFC